MAEIERDQRGDNKNAREKEGQCRPWRVDEVDPPVIERPCECPKIPEEAPKGEKRPCAEVKEYDCCEYLIEILKGMKGFEGIEIHKPKQSPKVKTANLCCSLPVKSSVVPVMMLFLRRFLQNKPPANHFEKQLRKYFSSLSADEVQTLVTGLKAYEEIPDSIRECAFESRFDGCDNEEILDPNFILKVWVHEAIVLGRNIVFHKNTAGPGKVRPWKKDLPIDPDTKKPKSIVGPWPWICEVCPVDENKEFKNIEVAEPGNVPIDKFNFEKHEFARSCTAVEDPNNPSLIIFECPPQKAPGAAPGSGGLGGGPCYGNFDNTMRYNFQDPNFGDLCLAIPDAAPGDAVTLKGLNFFSKRCQVRLRKIDSTFQPIDLLPCTVMGDDLDQKIATCEVRDLISFTIPERIKDKDNPVNFIPLPTGLYAVDVRVPNDTPIMIAVNPGAVPVEYWSNSVWLNIVPNPKESFRFIADSAFCNRDTAGPGSDEPWFQAFKTKVSLTGSKISVTGDPVEIFRANDVDQGESIPFTAPDLFNGSFEKGQVCAIAVIGLEVDSNAAAEKQIKDFGNAYLEYWNQFYTQLGVSTDLGILTDLLARGLLTPTILAIGLGALFAIALMGVLFALWAPADPLGFDFMALTALDLLNKTDPKKPLPPAQYFEFSDGKLILSVDPRPRQPKDIQPGGTHAWYYEDHIYVSKDEKSKYHIAYKVERT